MFSKALRCKLPSSVLTLWCVLWIQRVSSSYIQISFFLLHSRTSWRLLWMLTEAGKTNNWWAAAATQCTAAAWWTDITVLVTGQCWRWWLSSRCNWSINTAWRIIVTTTACCTLQNLRTSLTLTSTHIVQSAGVRSARSHFSNVGHALLRRDSCTNHHSNSVAMKFNIIFQTPLYTLLMGAETINLNKSQHLQSALNKENNCCLTDIISNQQKTTKHDWHCFRSL